MTEAFTKPIILTKEMGDRMVYALSNENRKKVEHFNKNVRPKYQSTTNRKNKVPLEEFLKTYDDKENDKTRI